MAEIKNVFAVSDTDESLQSKSGGVFGLNQNAHVTKFEFNPNAGKDNAPANAVDINIKIGEREFMTRLYEKFNVYKGGNQLSEGQEGYEEAYIAELVQRIAVIKHILRAVGVSEASIKATSDKLAGASVVDGMKALLALLPANYTQVPIDVFLHYQWSIRDNADRTYLELPNNMKTGHFACPHVEPVGEWKEVRDAHKLEYVDNAGNKHPFTRDENFLKGNRAKQQTKEDAQNNDPLASGGSQSSTAAAW